MTETTRIEYKQELTDGLEKEIIAFLNYHGGGSVYIGVDKTGKAIGLQDADRDALKIKDRLKNNIAPSCLGLFDLVIEETNGQTIIKILVASGPEKPYHLVKYGMTPKGAFLRVGTASEPMDQRIIDDLFAKRTRNSIGRIKSNRQDLSFQQLKIYYEGIGTTLNKQFLKNLELQTEEGKYNYVGYLMADENAVSVKVAKYAGKDKSDLIESEEYGYCSLIKATHQVLDKLEIENKTFTKITGDAQRKEHRLVDRTALREALINAMVHNDYTKEVPPVVEIYSDRLSITSYGGLVEGLSRDEFFEGRSMPRNRELMRIFRDLQFVENLGSGIHRILKKYDKSIFKISEHFIEICFPFDKDYMSGQTIGGQVEEKGGAVGGAIGGAVGGAIGGAMGGAIELTERQNEVLALIRENERIGYREVAEILGINPSAAQGHFDTLKEKNAIERVGGTRGYWKILI